MDLTLKVDKNIENLESKLNKFSDLMSEFIGMEINIASQNENGGNPGFKLGVNVKSGNREFNKEILNPLIKSAFDLIENYLEKHEVITDKTLLTFIEDLSLYLIFDEYIGLSEDEQFKYIKFIKELKELSVKTYESEPTSLGFILLKDYQDPEEIAQSMGMEFIDIEGQDLLSIILNEKPLLKLVDSKSLAMVLNPHLKVVGYVRKDPVGKSIIQTIQGIFETKEKKSLYAAIINSLHKTSKELITKLEQQVSGDSPSEKPIEDDDGLDYGLIQEILNEFPKLQGAFKEKIDELTIETPEFDFISLSKGQIDWYSDYNFHLSLSNSEWGLKHYGMLLSYIFEFLRTPSELLSNSLYKSTIEDLNKEIDMVSKFLNVVKNLSYHNKGALFVILNHNLYRDDIEFRDLDLFSELENDRESYKKVISRESDESLNIESIDNYFMESIASIDGATVMDRNLNILSFGELIKSDLVSKEGIYGARTKAALAGSKYGLAVKVSEDGDIEVYKEENLEISIK